jgi:hypothetical protein
MNEDEFSEMHDFENGYLPIADNLDRMAIYNSLIILRKQLGKYHALTYTKCKNRTSTFIEAWLLSKMKLGIELIQESVHLEPEEIANLETIESEAGNKVLFGKEEKNGKQNGADDEQSPWEA